MLKFINGSDVKVWQIVAVVYGPPNVGKTSLALTASKPALFDFDRGAHRAGNKGGKSIVAVSAWSDISGMNRDDFKGYSTIVVDTVGTCLDALAADVIRSDPKCGSGGTLNLRGYGMLKGRFRAWLDGLRSFGLDVVLVAHAAEEQRGDETFDRIIAAGSSKQEVYQQADIMGRFAIQGKDRVLSFDPTTASFGKNVGLADYIVKSPEQNPIMLAEIIAEAKELINKQSAVQQSEHDRLIAMRDTFTKVATTPAEFNDLIDDMADAPAADKKLLLEVAAEKGVEFDSKCKRFVVPEPAPVLDAPDDLSVPPW